MLFPSKEERELFPNKTIGLVPGRKLFSKKQVSCTITGAPKEVIILPENWKAGYVANRKHEDKGGGGNKTIHNK